MKQQTTQAIVLKRITFGEADRIIDVLTPDGRISMIAKGVRKPKSKLAGGIELLSVNDITYVDGRSDIKTITSSRVHQHFPEIIADISTTMFAYDVLKVVGAVTAHHTDSDYFDLLRDVLQQLDVGTIDQSVLQCWFLSQILQREGNHINLEKPVNAEAFSDNQHYEFSLSDMVFSCSEQGSYSPRHIKLLRLCAASGLDVIAAVAGADDVFADCAELLDSVSQYTIINE